MTKIGKIGLAGLGHIGKRHLSHIRAIGVSAVTADPTVKAEDALALGSAAHYGDYRDMLAREHPDAVVVGLPSPMHRECASAAFRAGAHALVEKPFSLTAQDAQAILDEARACGRRAMAAHSCRFMGQNVMAKQIVGSGELGRPLFMTAWRNTPTPLWSQGNWIGNRAASGGTVMDLMIHDVDLARWFLGPVRDAALVQRQGGASLGSGFFHVAPSLSFESGAAAMLEAGHLMPDSYVFTNGYRIVFEAGALEFFLRGYEPLMCLYEKGKATDLTQQYRDEWAGKNAFRLEMEHFIHCLETGEDFRVSDEDAVGAVETVIQLQNNEMFR